MLPSKFPRSSLASGSSTRFTCAVPSGGDSLGAIRKRLERKGRKGDMQRMIQRRGSNAVALAAVLTSARVCGSLSGCNALYSEGATTGAGIAGAGIAGAITSNAAVATGIGLGVLAGARAGVQYSQRVVHTDTQDKLATTDG